MNRFFLKTILLALFVSTLSLGQAIQQGDKIINLGIGLVGLGVNATAEYALNNKIGVGAFLGYERNSYNYYYTALRGGSYSRSNINFGVRGSFHAGELLSLDSKIDPYVAGGVGVNLYTDPYWDFNYNTGEYVSKSFVSPILLLRIGGRYYFNDKTAVFGEIGTAGSWISGGVSFKF